MMTATTTTDAHSRLPTLLTWFSPAFPIGAFAYSHGLESAVSDGRLACAEQVGEWIEALLLSGSGWNDLVLLAQGMRAAQDEARFVALSELAVALAGSMERREETQALGAAFGRAVGPWGEVTGEHPYPLVVAGAAAQAKLAPAEVLLSYAHAFSAGLVSAAVRLVPLGQSEALRLLKRLEPVIVEVAGRAEASTLDDLGSCTLLSDIAAMRHETLRTRLFRS